MTQTCAGCGNEFEAQRSTAKFCGSTCRSRGYRRGAPVAPSVSLVAAAERQLRESGRLDTVLGQQALELARALASTYSTGAAKAALSKELRAVMDEAMRGTKVVADPVDELRSRRVLKLAAG